MLSKLRALSASLSCGGARDSPPELCSHRQHARDCEEDERPKVFKSPPRKPAPIRLGGLVRGNKHSHGNDCRPLVNCVGQRCAVNTQRCLQNENMVCNDADNGCDAYAPPDRGPVVLDLEKLFEDFCNDLGKASRQHIL